MKARFRHAAATITSQVMLGLIVSAFGSDAFADPPKLEDVLQAWEARQESFKSVRIAWTEDRTDPKETGVRLPSSWKVVTIRDGKSTSSLCTISEIVVNPPVTDADFKIELPEGAAESRSNP